MFIESRLCRNTKIPQLGGRETNEKKMSIEDSQLSQQVGIELQNRQDALSKKVEKSQVVQKKREVKKFTEREKIRKENIIIGTGAVAINTLDENGNNILNKKDPQKPGKKESENLKKRKEHDQENAQKISENIRKQKNNVARQTKALSDSKKKFETRLSDIQKLQDFPNKKNQEKQIRKVITDLDAQLQSVQKKEDGLQILVIRNEIVLEQGKIDIEELENGDQFSQNSIDLIGDYVFRGIGLPRLKHEVFALDGLSQQEKKERYNQIATASILYKQSNPTAAQSVLINEKIYQTEQKSGEKITQKEQKKITEDFLLRYLTSEEKIFLKKDNGELFRKNIEIYESNKKIYIQSAVSLYPALQYQKNSITEKETPFLETLQTLNFEHLKYYQNISNQIDPREIKNLTHNKDGSTTMYLEEDIQLVIPKNNNPNDFQLRVGNIEKKISYNSKNIERTIEHHIAFQTLQTLGLEKYIKNPQHQLDFVNTCTTNYIEKSGKIGVNKSGRTEKYKQNNELLSFKDTILRVQKSLHKTLGIDYPVHEVTTKKIDKKGVEKLKKIKVLGKNGQYNPRGMRFFRELQIFSQRNAFHISADKFTGFRDRFYLYREAERLLKEDHLAKGNRENVANIQSVGGSERSPFAIDSQGDFVAL